MEAILDLRMGPPRPVSPFAQAGRLTAIPEAKPVLSRAVDERPEVNDPVHRGSSRSFSGLPIPQRSQLTPSQRMQQRRVEAKGENAGQKAYVTYVVG